MKIRELIGLLSAIALLFLGCSQAIDVGVERTKLLETDSEFAKMSVDQGTTAAFNAYLADNALQLPEGLNAVVGKANILDGMRKSEDLYTLEWRPSDGGVSKSGDLGWTWGEYTLDYLSKGNNEAAVHGKYLTIWKRQDNGDWKAIVDMGNYNPKPLPEAEIEQK
jgi:ketosteroid isomerase-like protein